MSKEELDNVVNDMLAHFARLYNVNPPSEFAVTEAIIAEHTHPVVVVNPINHHISIRSADADSREIASAAIHTGAPIDLVQQAAKHAAPPGSIRILWLSSEGWRGHHFRPTLVVVDTERTKITQIML